MSYSRYAELHCYSPFSFQRGASPISELLPRARDLGLTALAVTDRDGLYGAVRQWLQSRSMRGSEADRQHPVPTPVYGAELCLEDSSRVVALVRDTQGWRNLCTLISEGRGACEKGSSVISLNRLVERSSGLIFLSGGRFGPIDRALLGLDGMRAARVWRPRGPWGRGLGRRDGQPDSNSREPDSRGHPEPARRGISGLCRQAQERAELYAAHRDQPSERLRRAVAVAASFRDALGDRFLLEVQDHHLPEDQWLRSVMANIGTQLGLARVATNMVHYARAGDRCLQDVLTCIRTRSRLDNVGTRLLPNAHFRLKGPDEMARLFADDIEVVERTVDIAVECRFDLADLPYSFPVYPVPAGHSLQSFLENITWDGAKQRYGERLAGDPRIRAQLEHELDVIGRMGLAGYFLVVWDLVQECRRRGILCQGRGSAANSCVCYCLGITAVDPIRLDLLFERFLSEARGGYPDIDVDISNNRREEILQFVYQKYGREHAAMVCNIITYHPRSAVRDVGKVFGLSDEQIGPMCRELRHHRDTEALKQFYGVLAEADGAQGLGTFRQVLKYSDLLCGLPRHIGIHSGGIVISGLPLSEVCPIENAAMVDRTVLQWDKDDVAHAGLVKIDLLALGMLSAIQEAGELLALRSVDFDMAQLTYDDPRVYDMVCAADTVGLFQIESRAQMNTLPRLRPRTFHDLVVEVALIRPGPIQGDMVHPYLRRRQGREPVSYAHPSLQPILERTLGIPLFQEQAMKMAVATAGFSPAQADQLRKAMGFKRATGALENLFAEMLRGMRSNGIEPEVAQRICEQLRGFAAYGFPESHAASFALIVYASAWLKCYQAPAFFAALLNCQPMGFYSPATLVADARRHGVLVAPVSAAHSSWKWTLEGEFGMRAGFQQLRSFAEADGERIVAARAQGEFRSVADFCDRSGLDRDKLELLADAGAFDNFGVPRRQALWQVAGWRRRLPLEGPSRQESLPTLRPLAAIEQNLLDHHVSGFSAAEHPLTFIRAKLRELGVADSTDLLSMGHGAEVYSAGLVIARQRPDTASGTFFVTLEDECGFINLIVRPAVFERHERMLRQVRFMGCRGRVQSRDGVVHILAHEFEDLGRSGLLEGNGNQEPSGTWELVACRDFH